MATLGETIRARRDELGMTQEQLAQRLGVGFRQSEISRLEHDRVTLPRRPRLEQLAAALEFNVGELLLRSGWAGVEEIGAGERTSAEWQEQVERLTTANVELTAVNVDLQAQVNDLERANESWQRWGNDKELDLRVAEAAITQLEAVLDALPDPVVVVSPSGVVLVENDAYSAFSDRHTDEPPMRGCDGVLLAQAELPLDRASRGEQFDIKVMIEGSDLAVYRVTGRSTTTLRGGRIGVVTFHHIPT